MSVKAMPSIIESEREPLQDHCGIVAMFALGDARFFNTGLAGLEYLQTRGYDGAGFWAMNTYGDVSEHKGVGMVKEVFSPSVVQKYATFAARIWLYQVRYGTNGAFQENNVQPMVRVHHKSQELFAVVHNGQFSSTPESLDTQSSDTLRFVEELAYSPGATWDDRVQQVIYKKHGAWSLIIGTKDALYISRDPFGFRPLSYGHLLDPTSNQSLFIVASETSALAKMGVVDVFELLPATLAKVTGNGLEIVSRQTDTTRASCIFENVYIQRGSTKALLPRKKIRDIAASPTVSQTRKKCGIILAREAPLTKSDVDIVIGVPGTGIVGGEAFAEALSLPYAQAITDKPTPYIEQRTFMTAEISSIYKKVLNHFAFKKELLANKRVVLVDDSIVRGNISKGLVGLLQGHYNVVAVHFRILSPPIDKACHLGVNTRSSDELIAARYYGNVEKIRQEIGATTLAYLTSEGLREAMTGNPKASGFCMGCMVGNRYPIDSYGNAINGITQSHDIQDSAEVYPKTPAIFADS